MADLVERVAESQRIHLESASRFDYFMTGGAGVTLGFALKELPPTLGPVAVFLLPVAWAFLLAALGAGIAHLNAVRRLLKNGHESVTYVSELVDLRTAARLGTRMEVTATGHELSSPQVMARIQQLSEHVDALTRKSKVLAASQHVLASIRNIMLFSGFGALALWRALNLVR